MTIFLQIVKILLPIDIRGVSKKSVAADSSAVNSVLGWFGGGRDKTLSEKKRGHLEDLLFNLRELQDVKVEEDGKDKISDEATLVQIKALLDLCKEKAAEESRAKSVVSEGATGPALDQIGVYLDNIYKKLRKVHLLNIPNDEDPLNKFRYYMGFYFAKKVDESRHPSLFSSLAAVNEVTLLKENIILKCLDDCSKALRTFDKTLEDYPTTWRARVVEYIERLERENTELCNSHSSNFDLPISLSLLGGISISMPIVGPELGTLGQCIVAAKTEVSEGLRPREEATYSL